MLSGCRRVKPVRAEETGRRNLGGPDPCRPPRVLGADLLGDRVQDGCPLTELLAHQVDRIERKLKERHPEVRHVDLEVL